MSWMCIDRRCVGTWESKLCSVCVLTEGAFEQGRVSYVLYMYRQRLRWYRGEYIMNCICIVSGCVGTGENKLISVCVSTEGGLVQGRVSYVLYVYWQKVRLCMGDNI